MAKQNGPRRKESSWRPIVDAIAAYQRHNGYSPSMSELCYITGKSHTTIRFHINRLCEDGILTRTPGKMRSIKIVE